MGHHAHTHTRVEIPLKTCMCTEKQKLYLSSQKTRAAVENKKRLYCIIVNVCT
jgi:hypothetical protein